MKLQQDFVGTEHKQRIYRPWGFYEKLVAGINYQVKYLMINPKSALSLQLHYCRSEQWVVISGAAEVINEGAVFRLNHNQSTYIVKRYKASSKQLK
ncbi:phosphomannose isomerase type II C-terminal cupin domain [Coxiella endosymbiont of Amblyomma nuttalli]|uniref:phosphomannose isomerase type II C-terminal cupin domain n=1 Tax=Coxiella endosymbiont of Amblyomma nuttalli TaxID=2749996 RepID=UPI001BB6EDB3|nr:Alginate biosynthesis protein AlgA [Coxiella endosymbiont of Amblyomma nuttalli]